MLLSLPPQLGFLSWAACTAKWLCKYKDEIAEGPLLPGNQLILWRFTEQICTWMWQWRNVGNLARRQFASGYLGQITSNALLLNLFLTFWNPCQLRRTSDWNLLAQCRRFMNYKSFYHLNAAAQLQCLKSY